jgi:hypothetical protein
MFTLQNYIESLFSGWTLSVGGVVSIFLAVFLISSWSIAFVGAFCRVRRTPLYVAMLSVGMGMLMSLLLAGLVHGHFPEIANEFTPWGLLIISFVLTSFVFSIPLVQALWHTSYFQGFCCVAGGYFLIICVMLAIQMSAQPVKSLPARPTIPIFQN